MNNYQSDQFIILLKPAAHASRSGEQGHSNRMIIKYRDVTIIRCIRTHQSPVEAFVNHRFGYSKNQQQLVNSEGEFFRHCAQTANDATPWHSDLGFEQFTAVWNLGEPHCTHRNTQLSSESQDVVGLKNLSKYSSKYNYR
jgi:hypothetical protein